MENLFATAQNRIDFGTTTTTARSIQARVGFNTEGGHFCTTPGCSDQAVFDRYHLTSVESWEEFKDNLEVKEEIPEEEVDELERCIDKCWWRDNWRDVKGVSHEELTENAQRDPNLEVPKACPKCVAKIPQHLDADKTAVINNVMENAKKGKSLL